MGLRPTKGDEDAAGTAGYFRRFFAASSTERLVRTREETAPLRSRLGAGGASGYYGGLQVAVAVQHVPEDV
jgi:hypothetical protein